MPYRSISQAMWYVYYGMVMNNQDISTFDERNRYNLTSLFVFASFIMIIVLSNMLIAIMGNTFAQR